MTRQLRYWRLALTIVCAVGLGIAGCTSAEQPKPATPRDRNTHAVLAALRQLDMCALLGSAIEATSGFPGAVDLEANDPFTCLARVTADQREDQTIFSYVTGFGQSARDRTRHDVLVRTELGGATAYVSGPVQDCRVYLPVSFTLAIDFSSLGVSPCGQLEDVAASAAAILTEPSRVSGVPMWDACSALTEALGAEAADHELGTPFPIHLFECEDRASGETRVELSFESRDPVVDEPASTETIGGKQVRVRADRYFDTCFTHWRHAPFTASHATAPDYQVIVEAPDCSRSRTVAESVMKVLEQPPPTDVAPQRPLLYRPDDPNGPPTR